MGCSWDPGGIDPPRATLNFPVALGLSAPDCEGAPCFLVVVNSNFDLRYNAGTVQSYDLHKIDAAANACTALPCELSQTAEFLVAEKAEVKTESYGSAIALSPSARRFYVPIQSEGALAFIDIDAEGALFCGGSGDFPRCDSSHKVRSDTVDNDRDTFLAPDPIDVVASTWVNDWGVDISPSEYVLLAHRSGNVSLWLDDSSQASHKPWLVDSIDTQARNLTGLAWNVEMQRWVATSSRSSVLETLGIELENVQVPEKAYLFHGDNIRLTGLDDGSDVRAVAFAAQGFSSRAYVLSRRPEALLMTESVVGRTLSGNALWLSRIVRTGLGSSRMLVTQLGDPLRTFIFVSCFDSRELIVIDAELETAVAIVPGFTGPFELALDAARQRLYIADFRASVIQIVDISPLAVGQNPRILARLGKPRPVEELN